MFQQLRASACGSMSISAILRITAAESDPAEEQWEQRWRRGRPAGSGERQSPEDGGYLLLLAAARQRGGSAHQTMGGFEVAHCNRGNGFSVPNTGTRNNLHNCPPLWVRKLSGPPQEWFLKATRCWIQVRVRRSVTHIEMVSNVRQRGCYNRMLAEV